MKISKKSPARKLAALLLVLSSLAQAAPITRSEVLSTAAAYAAHRWSASSGNILHGLDPDKVAVETPDGAASNDAAAARLWSVGVENIGVPYKWGGFDSLESFDQGIGKGRAAGDLYNAEKRKKGGAAVSRQAVGVDCSGFISRCWKLSKKESTSSLSGLCLVLPSIEALRAGDVMNQAGGHVVLFVRWKDASHNEALFYEAEPFSKVILSERNAPELLAQGFRPMRYRPIVD